MFCRPIKVNTTNGTCSSSISLFYNKFIFYKIQLCHHNKSASQLTIWSLIFNSFVHFNCHLFRSLITHRIEIRHIYRAHTCTHIQCTSGTCIMHINQAHTFTHIHHAHIHQPHTFTHMHQAHTSGTHIRSIMMIMLVLYCIVLYYEALY